MGKKSAGKNRRTKTTLVFDEDARKDWLQGFSKRKKERQQKAKDDLASLLKDERLRQKQEYREKLQKSEDKYLHKLKEVEEILEEKTKAYDCGDKTVEITEYDLVNQESLLGRNEEDEESEKNTQGGNSNSDEEVDTETAEVHQSIKMPRKPTKALVKIEKRLYKLTTSKRKMDGGGRSKLKSTKSGKMKGRNDSKLAIKGRERSGTKVKLTKSKSKRKRH